MPTTWSLDFYLLSKEEQGKVKKEYKEYKEFLKWQQEIDKVHEEERLKNNKYRFISKL